MPQKKQKQKQLDEIVMRALAVNKPMPESEQGGRKKRETNGKRMSNYLVRISIIFFSLIFVYFVLIGVDSDLCWLKTFFRRSLNLLFSRLGFGGLAALAIGFLLQALFSADEGFFIGNGMIPHGAAESTNSDLFTYTSDLVEDSRSSGRSSSTSTVNQPLAGEQAMHPALPVMQEAANQALPNVPYPYPPDLSIGGDSVESILQRILGRSPSPSAHDIQMAQIAAQDLFEVKVDICRVMAGLHPSGDWMGRGARALDNPRTLTGEDSLENLHETLSDLRTAGRGSPTFRKLVARVPFRADEDQHSAA